MQGRPEVCRRLSQRAGSGRASTKVSFPRRANPWALSLQENFQGLTPRPPACRPVDAIHRPRIILVPDQDLSTLMLSRKAFACFPHGKRHSHCGFRNNLVRARFCPSRRSPPLRPFCRAYCMGMLCKLDFGGLLDSFAQSTEHFAARVARVCRCWGHSDFACASCTICGGGDT